MPWVGSSARHSVLLGALGRYNEEQKFKIIISYVVSSRPSSDTQTSVPNKIKQDLRGGSVGREV